ALRWFLKWRYRKIPKQLEQLGFQAPQAWLSNDVTIPFLQKLVILLSFFPYHVLTSLLYQVYKIQASRRIKVPNIFFE
ncbi:MAG: hypothetical protein AAFO82_24535, partial [Bacteroidota bacterium]